MTQGEGAPKEQEDLDLDKKIALIKELQKMNEDFHKLTQGEDESDEDYSSRTQVFNSRMDELVNNPDSNVSNFYDIDSNKLPFVSFGVCMV
ncbi:MAG: hypothetical protein EXS47_00275 [Candidatus Zambryskibacteria bacterium]|nr:hypothetical protein [Candidatus Zambryskibacteria bacterium]